MDKQYKPQEFEDKIYRKWEKSGAFKPSKKEKPFRIIMPPPNANASLHAGHGMYTVEDVLIRWKRMQGYAAHWLPGMDHAGFETQFVFEKKLKKEGKSRMDFDRQTLYNKIAKFVEDNSGLIYEQFKKLGFSANWKRSVFSLDKKVVDQVFKTFKKMESEKLVYRGEYLVNYCTKCGTSLAELEVNHIERKDPLYYIKYGPFTLATVRPETKFGDTAIAVHPDDKRYKKWVGKEVEVEGLLGKFKIKVIADKYVDMEFGTGVVKITPAHDPNDFEVGKRHNLEIKQVIGLDGRLNKQCGKYEGLTVFSARKKVIKDLQEKGLMVKIDKNYIHSITVCYKCGRDLEPTIIPNWFIKVKSLKPAVIKAVKEDQVKFYPKRFKKQMLEWMKIMHDWPISRQIVWGIRIPIWYNISGHEVGVVASFINKAGKQEMGTVDQLSRKGYSVGEIKRGLQQIMVPIYQGNNNIPYTVSDEMPKSDGVWLPETDTFDTWFSSGQWPQVTVKKSEGLPTDVMGTLADILKFWISRMMMFSLYLEKKIPFKDIYLWSMVADKKGLKMSKSKGNVINPIDLIDKYGADALRMALIFGTAPGSKIILSDDKVRGMRNFTNKIWNAARFVSEFLPNMDKLSNKVDPSFANAQVNGTKGASQKGINLYPGDEDFKKKLNKTVKTVTEQLEKYQLGLAAETVYGEFWHWFCDESIEKAKEGKISYPVLLDGLRTFLKLLHPFVPFVTEAVWGELGENSEPLLIKSKWPNAH
ncbi:valine--tRNA ligase [Patescibacteria group bacterium]|nr:valine--tRNA ligase [Patescibacteria group bacterium]